MRKQPANAQQSYCLRISVLSPHPFRSYPPTFYDFISSKNAMQNYYFFLKLSPFNSIRCDVWTILSKMASAKVSSLKMSNQLATGS